MMTQTINGNVLRVWKRLGYAGFLFFLIKGILWLAVPFVLYLTRTMG